MLVSPTSPGVPVHAIVLDHDPEYADILTDILSFIGDRPATFTTTSPEAMLHRITRKTYDVILMTHESGGERLLVDLRRLQPDAVVVVSADATMPSRQISRYFAAGADEVLERPLHPTVLAARLNRLLLVRARIRAAVATAHPFAVAGV